MRHFILVLAALIVSRSAFGQSYTISTIAGGGLPVNISGTSASLSFNNPEFIAADQAGNILFADQNLVMRLGASTGVLTLVAGTGTIGFSGDNGPATNAQLNNPIGVAVDSVGNVYFADAANYRVRKVSASSGVITTVAGNGSPGYSGDNGPATNAQLDYPNSVSVDSAGAIYIAEFDNRIRKVANGVITTVAGNGTAGFSGDNGPATAAQLSILFGGGLAVDATGSLYIADASNQRVRKVSNGVITTIAGNGVQGFSGDGASATNAEFNIPTALAVDAAGNLYISDFSNSRVRKVSNGVITTVAGKGGGGFGGDNGPATSAQLSGPTGVALDAAGNLYIVDFENGRIRKVSNGAITTIAGNGSQSFSGDNGPPTSAQLSGPTGLAVDSAGGLYVTDTGNNRIRKISNGVIATVAGNGTQGFSGDNGPATNASLREPEGVGVDSAGNIYIADSSNSRIRKVSGGLITTVAGNGAYGLNPDNFPATIEDLNLPNDVATDLAGNFYIADRLNNRIRKVENGIMTTVAGGGTQFGDNGPAAAAELNDPSAVVLDAEGNIYIADTSNNRIRKVSGGIITTVAGDGNQGFSGDNGPAASAELSAPASVAVDSAGNLYIADTGNSRIRRVANGVITTMAGGGTQAGDNGPATSAQLGLLFGVAVDSAGNVYIADSLNNRIRLLQPQPSINSGGILNAASSAVGAPVAAGSIATVYGAFLVAALSTAPSAPLPINLGGLSLQFGSSLAAPLFAVSGGQINFQVPWELAGQAQTAVSASWNGQTSATQTLNLAPYAPGIFSINSQGSGQGAILDSSYNLVNASNPATAGVTILQIYCTGLGPVANQPASGSPASNTQLSRTTATATVTIGGVSGPALFAGLAPGSVGEYQVDALVPAGSSKGAAVPVIISIGGATSNTVTIAVK